MAAILVLSVGTNAAYHMVKTLKREFGNDIRIIGADINERYLLPSDCYLDAFYKVPYNNADGYYDTIINICKSEKINYILPIFDKDQIFFYKENPDLLRLNIKSFGISKKVIDIYKNKKCMNDFLISNGFKVPQIFSREKILADESYFIKPVDGCGSIGTKVLKGYEILKLDNLDGYLIQEVCKEPEYTTECFYYENTLRTVTRERIATKSGVCTKARLFYCSEFNSVADKLTKCLTVPLCYNFQTMKNSNSEDVITDVNLRLAGGMSIAAAAGWDEALAIGKIMLNHSKEDVMRSVDNVYGETYIVRAYQDIITDSKNEIAAFDLDGTLLDSRKRHNVVLKAALKHFSVSLDFSQEELINFKRNGKNNKDFLILKGVSPDIATSIQEYWIKNIEAEEFIKHDKLYDNFTDLINTYSNYDLILITARANSENLHKQLSNLKIADYFKNIYVIPTNSDVALEKSKILSSNHVKLFVGDTKLDYKAAMLSNVEFRFMNRGFHDIDTVLG